MHTPRPTPPQPLPAPTGLRLHFSPGLRALLAALAVAGLVGPWALYLHHLATGGSFAPDRFFADATANALTAGVTLDVYLAALGFGVAAAADRDGGRARWWVLPACLVVGLSAVLPAYLWWRSRAEASGHQGASARA